MGKSLFDKVWEAHTVAELPSGQTQLFIGLHLVHEVTSPQAFQMLRELQLPVALPERTFATVDHIIPTDTRTARPFDDEQAETMMSAIERNCRDFGIRSSTAPTGNQGIVHVIGPEHGTHPAGNHHRLRRQPHLHARRLRQHRLRHRHQPGARRARLAVPGDREAQGAPHRGERRAAAPASTPRTSSCTSSARSA